MKKPTIAVLKKQVQKYFNEYIRNRDSSNGVFTCISCQGTYPVENMVAGHFFGTRKYNWMRFLETNCHGECSYCNSFNHESLIGYTLNLPDKIGKLEFNKLLKESKERKQEFSRDELERLKEYYKTRVFTIQHHVGSTQMEK